MGDLVRLFPEVEGVRGLGPRKSCRRGTSARAWFERGQALEATDALEARVAYRRALSADGRLGDAHCNLGRLLHEGGEVLAAESHYRLALCAEPAAAIYWFNLGVAVEDQGRSAEAIDLYRQALVCDGSLADAHFNLAGLLGKAGDLRSAREAFRHLHRYRALRRAS